MARGRKNKRSNGGPGEPPIKLNIIEQTPSTSSNFTNNPASNLSADAINHNSGNKDHNPNNPKISIDNQYSHLLNASQETLNEMLHNNNNQTDKKKKNVKPPVIVVVHNNYKAVYEILKSISIENFALKLMSVGLKIITASLDDHKKCIEYFKSSGIHYYSHDLANQQPVKVVMSGLPNLEIDYILEDLKAQHVNPFDIKPMKIRQKRNADSTLYLLHFERGTVNINKLRQVKVVCNCIVNWEYYASTRVGPVQCRKCQMFGHGTRHCGIPARCVKCGADHLTENCETIKKPAGQTTPDESRTSLKCANCLGNHTANFSACPKRLEYIRIQQDLKEKSKQKIHRNLSSNSTNNNNNNYQSNSHSNSGNINNRMHTNTQQIVFNNNNALYSQVLNNNPADNLFSLAEILALNKEIIMKLSGCRNKVEQFQVITELSIKYLYNVYK
jgi:hypothetical protein